MNERTKTPKEPTVCVCVCVCLCVRVGGNRESEGDGAIDEGTDKRRGAGGASGGGRALVNVLPPWRQAGQ